MQSVSRGYGPIQHREHSLRATARTPACIQNTAHRACLHDYCPRGTPPTGWTHETSPAGTCSKAAFVWRVCMINVPLLRLNLEPSASCAGMYVCMYICKTRTHATTSTTTSWSTCSSLSASRPGDPGDVCMYVCNEHEEKCADKKRRMTASERTDPPFDVAV